MFENIYMYPYSEGSIEYILKIKIVAISINCHLYENVIKIVVLHMVYINLSFYPAVPLYSVCSNIVPLSERYTIK